LKNLNRKGYGVATIGDTLMYVCHGNIIYVLSLGIELSRGRIEIQLYRFNTARVFGMSQTRTWISKVICGGLLFKCNDLRWEVIVHLLVLVELMTFSV